MIDTASTGAPVLPPIPHFSDALMKLWPHGDSKIPGLRSAMTELSPEVGDGGNRKGGISWGCLTPPLLHQRSDMPCPKITSSS